MRMLTVNVGSSSLELSVVEDGHRLASHAVGPDEDRSAALRTVLLEWPGIEAVGHRVVHGGSRFRGPTRVDDALLDHLRSDTWAPLHNGAAAEGIDAVRGVAPDLPAVACFDTTYFLNLPAAAATYALPRAWNERWGLRRHGAHGLSHAHAVRRGAALIGRPVEGLRVVSAHLGSGASLAAVVDGRPVDTSMGLTPLEGLVMRSRSGSVDPGLLLWLLRHTDLGADEIEDALWHRSGLAGLSGTSGDLRAVHDAAEHGEEGARLAYAVFVHRVRRELGAMLLSAGGLDLLVFTGGIGTNDPVVRRDVVAGAAPELGLRLDEDRNAATVGTEGDLSASAGLPAVAVVEAGEDLEIVAQAQRHVAHPPRGAS